METTNKEFSAHFSGKFTPEIQAFGRETLLKECFDCLIVTDREDKEKAYCTHCKKWVKIPGNSLHTGSPRNAWRREREEACYCHAGYMNIPEEELKRRKDIQKRKIISCPSCGYGLSVYHQWRMDMSQLNCIASISVWAKSKIQPDAITMRRIEIERHFGNDAAHVVEDKYVEAERYLFRMGYKTVRQKCIEEEYNYKTKKWHKVKRFIKRISDRAQMTGSDPVRGHYRMDLRSLKRAAEGTPYQYLFKGGNNYLTYYDEYEYRDDYPLYMVKYLDLYGLHPWIELLEKNLMGNLVIDHIRREGCTGVIRWTAKTIRSAAKRFTKQDLKDILAHNKKEESMRCFVNEKELEFLVKARKTIYPGMTLDTALKLANEGFEQLEKLHDMCKKLKLRTEKVVTWCLKGKKGRYSHAIGDWLDYLGDAKKLGLDLTRECNLFPKDLQKMHANISRQIKYRHDREIKKRVKETLAIRNELFRLEGNKYLIRPAESVDEIINEGRELQHCVGGYAERHANGETNILFIRETDRPEVPFVTMEVKPSAKGYYIAQIHGYLNDRNKPLPEEVTAFAESFIKIVNERAKKLKKKVRKTA